MTTAEDLDIKGILHFNELKEYCLTKDEIRLILNDALDIGPLVPSLFKDLEMKGHIDELNKVKLGNIVQCLFSNSFLS
jgi:hypothetical protein